MKTRLRAFAKKMRLREVQSNMILKNLRSSCLYFELIVAYYKFLIPFKKLENYKEMTTFFSSSNIESRLRNKFKYFLIKESNAPPFLYFLLFIYFHFWTEKPSNPFTLLLFATEIVMVVVCNFNYFYIVSPFLNTRPIASIPMLVISLFFCNSNEKMYLFLLAVGDSIFKDQSQTYFLAFFSFLISCQIYSKFIFKTISDNIQYFVGMTSVASFYSIQIISAYFTLKISLGLNLVLMIILASLAYSLICWRIEKLKNSIPDHIYSSRLIAHYLKMLEQTSDPYFLKIKILLHSRKCKKQFCFCHIKEDDNQVGYFMRQLYQNAIQTFNDHSLDSLLYENYVDFLLKNEQMINALHFLSKWQPRGFFSFVGKERMMAKVEELLLNANSSNVYQLHYQHALEYDKNYKWMAQEINEILKIKLQFWREVGRECPKVVRMQKLGSQIITRMYELNVFYSRIIKKYEKSIFLFDATALYAMYMLSTTNFKQYAELIIKNTSKLLEDVFAFQSNLSETYAIRTVVKQEQNYLIDHPHETLKSLFKMNQTPTLIEVNNKSCYKLIIDSVSSGFCKIINFERNNLIGKQLNTLIPVGYKEVHNVRLSYLLNFNSEPISEIVPSKVMHQELKLPIRGGNGQLIIGFVCIKFVVDVNIGLAFVSVVKLAKDQSNYMLVDFSGKINEITDGLDKEILNHGEIQRYLSKSRESWEAEKVIREEQFNLMINTNSYSITISSPLLGLFLEKKNLKEKCPPIHIEITSEDFNRNRASQINRHNKIGQQIKQMEKAIHNQDTASSSFTSKGTSSAVTIISNFSQNNSTPLYRYLQIAFFISILSCVTSNLATYYLSQLPWDVTSSHSNPLNDTMNMYAIQMLTLKAYIIIEDEMIYISGKRSLNYTRIAQYFGNAKSMEMINSELETAFKDSILNYLKWPSDLLKPTLNKRFTAPLSVPIPIGSTFNFSSNNVTFQELMMIYVTDLNLLSRLQIKNIILSYSLTQEVITTQNSSQLSIIIDEAVNHRQNISIGVNSALVFLIFILLVPLHIFLKKRLQLHQKVFEILVQIDSQHVSNEIQSLDYICSIMRNYKESNQIMKMNILDYRTNIIHPKKSRRSSADNQMILGLEKYDPQNDGNQKKAKQQPNGLSSKTKLVNSPKYSIINNIPTTATAQKLESQSYNNSQKDSRSVVNLIKTGFLNSQNESRWSKRRRSGDLDLAGSNLDPSQLIKKENCTLYLMLLSFVLILAANLYLQLKFNSTYLSGKDDIIAIYNDQVAFSLDRITFKFYLMVGPKYFAQTLGVSNAMAFFMQKINGFPNYKYYDGSDFYSKVQSDCLRNASLLSSFQKKYCQNDYSEVILKGEYGVLYKQIVQMIYLVNLYPSNFDNITSIMNNIDQKWLYMESLNSRLQQFVIQKIQLTFNSLVQLGRHYDDSKLILLRISLVWGVVCFLWGFIMLIGMKQNYLREVYIITFLNTNMIMKNKRVESFLDSLSKTNST